MAVTNCNTVNYNLYSYSTFPNIIIGYIENFTVFPLKTLCDNIIRKHFKL